MTLAREDYKYAISIKSQNLAVIYCARALADFSQKTGNTRIAWAGTSKDAWRRDGHVVTFHFSRPEYRDGLVTELRQLLPENAWLEQGRSDNASPSSQD